MHEKERFGDYNHYAATILSRAFCQGRVSAYASTVSLNRALIFLYAHFELFDVAEVIFTHAQRMGLTKNITTLNLRLASALRWNLAPQAISCVAEGITCCIA